MQFQERIKRELDELRSLDRYRILPDITSRHGKHITVNGQLLLNLSSNDYLGLGDDKEMLAGYVKQLRESKYAMTSSSSRLLTGNHPLYDQLENALAKLYGREAALVFNSGYHANIGIIPALSGRHDLVLSDRKNHASIIDGMKITEALCQRYRHLDYDHLEELLAGAAGRYRQIFIITESVFSMDGDLADLSRLVALKEKYGAVLIVDEAHGVGVFGERGLGLCETAGFVQEIDVITGTFGKALASTGAYAVMSSLFREYLLNTMRSFIFTTALPPAILGWSLLTLDRQSTLHFERQALLQLASRLRSELIGRSLDVPGESHIVPVITGSNASAVALAALLKDAGFHCMPVRPPTVPEKSARIRISLRSTLQWEDIAMIPELIGG
ncbi:MAG: 8-amino-7-oxononanoate synthase [Chlorobiaceae bacterium]|nr:8-amino-7-oxononanoate synthase [Chlorobiaceae bacterium]NTV16424.1 8-amino-7-oxononanoate synthase [Chlorobiaceae bacterium]